MAGTAVDGQLSTRAVERDVRYTLATPADDAAIRQLLRDHPTRGAISLSFEREPDYFSGESTTAGETRTILAYEANRLVCMGRSTTRELWLNGAVRRVAYLGELRLAADARGRFGILRGGYEFFHALHQATPADFTFTSIAADNLGARKLLERGVRGLPRYRFLTEFVTLLIPTARFAGRPCNSRVTTAGADELAAFLDDQASRFHLANSWTQGNLTTLSQHGLTPEQFSVWRERGKIVAATAVWDQRSFRQTVIRGYSPSLAMARPALNIVRGLLGLPRLPDPGTMLAHAFLAPLAIVAGQDERLREVIGACSGLAAQRGLEFITLGFSSDDPRLALARRHFRGRAYRSRLYAVGWPDDPTEIPLDQRYFLPEVAFL